MSDNRKWDDAVCWIPVSVPFLSFRVRPRGHKRQSVMSEVQNSMNCAHGLACADVLFLRFGGLRPHETPDLPSTRPFDCTVSSPPTDDDYSLQPWQRPRFALPCYYHYYYLLTTHHYYSVHAYLGRTNPNPTSPCSSHTSLPCLNDLVPSPLLLALSPHDLSSPRERKEPLVAD